MKLPWGDKPEWTSALVSAVRNSKLPDLVPADIASFTSAYGSIDERIAFWANLISMMAKFESGWNPKAVYVEPDIRDAQGNNVASSGLLQISIESARSYGFKGTAQDLFDPIKNLQCAVMIIENRIQKHRTLTGQVAGKWQGVASYWSVMRSIKSSKPRPSFEAIRAHTLTLKKLEAPMKPENRPVNPVYTEAKKHAGKKETDKTFSAYLSKYWGKVGLPGYKTIAGSTYAWCALFIAAMSINAGVGYVKTRGASAKAQDAYGVAIDWKRDGIPRGAVVRVNSGANCSSSSGNHVTFADGDCTLEDLKRGTFPGFGGNQANSVKRSTYKVANICAVRWPAEIAKPSKVTKSVNCVTESSKEESTR